MKKQTLKELLIQLDKVNQELEIIQTDEYINMRVKEIFKKDYSKVKKSAIKEISDILNAF